VQLCFAHQCQPDQGDHVRGGVADEAPTGAGPDENDPSQRRTEDPAHGREGGRQGRGVRRVRDGDRLSDERAADRRLEGMDDAVGECEQVEPRLRRRTTEHQGREQRRLSGGHDLDADQQRVLVMAIRQRAGPRRDEQRRRERRRHDPAKRRAAPGDFQGDPGQRHELQPAPGLRDRVSDDEQPEVSGTERPEGTTTCQVRDPRHGRA